MDHQSQQGEWAKQLHHFTSTMREFARKMPSLFQVKNIAALRERFQSTIALLSSARNRDALESLELLQKNFEENHVDYHLISSVKDLLKGLSGTLADISQNSTEPLILMERLGHPWERPLIQELKYNFPSVTIFESSASINNFYELKKLSRNAALSITSADLIVAETGTLILFDRNRLRGVLTTTSRHHVVIVPVTKVIFSHDEAIPLVGKTLRLRTGKIDAHVHVISNPSRTGDIEKIIVYGAHGPLKLEVYLLDVEDLLGLADKSEDLFLLKRHSGILELLFRHAFPWISEVTRVLEIPCVDVVSISWFYEFLNASTSKSMQYFLFLKFLESFIQRAAFIELSPIIRDVFAHCNRMATKFLQESGNDLKLISNEVESHLQNLVIEVFSP